MADTVEQSTPKDEVANVSEQLSPIRTEKPEEFVFYQVEVQFSVCRITAEETKIN